MIGQFVQRYQNAKICIAQIRRGEWRPNWNPISRSYITAERGELVLWIGNGAFYVDIDNKNYFGFLFRQWCWWAAARALSKTNPPESARYRVPILSDEA